MAKMENPGMTYAEMEEVMRKAGHDACRVYTILTERIAMMQDRIAVLEVLARRKTDTLDHGDMLEIE